MGKGSGASSRPGLDIEPKVNEDNYEALDASPILVEKDFLEDLDFTPIGFNTDRNTWESSDGKIAFYKTSDGWSVSCGDEELEPVLEQAGLSNDNPPFFSTLKEAREASLAIAQESEVNLSSKLKRPPGSQSYRVGNLPFSVTRYNKIWYLNMIVYQKLPEEIAQAFPNGSLELKATWENTYLESATYPTRKQAINAVRNFLDVYTQKASTQELG
jgi:hypothetical protein